MISHSKLFCKIYHSTYLLCLCVLSDSALALNPSEPFVIIERDVYVKEIENTDTYDSQHISENRTLENVIVSAKRKKNSNISGSFMQIMNEDVLSRISSASMSDAVKRFSGTVVKDYGGIGGLKTVNVRSMGSEHTGVIYDGISVSNCQSGQIDLSNFSLDNVSNLSLCIGQNDDIFQSAKILASASTLFIETKRPVLSKEMPFTINASYRGGSFDLYNPGIFMAMRLSERFSYSIYADYINSDGTYPFVYKNGNKDISEKRNNSDIEAVKSELNLFYNFSENKRLDAKFNLLISDRGLPGSVIYDNDYAAERLSDKSYYLNLKYENKVSDRFIFKSLGRLNYSWNKHSDKQVYETRDNLYSQYEAYLSFVGEINPIKGVSISFAQDYTYNYLDSNIKDFVFPHRNNFQSAIVAKYSNNYLSFIASGLYTYIQEKVKYGNDPDSRKRLSPAASLSVRPFLNSSFRVRASYKDIYRVPTFNDLYYRVVGNKNLRPEIARQFNAGIVWSGNPLSFTEYISLSADFYHNIIDDKIIAIPTTFIWKMMNVSKVKTSGLDLNCVIECNISELIKLNITSSYSYMSAKNRTNKSSVLWGAQIPYTPRNSGNGTAEIKTKYFSLGYSVVATSKRYYSDINIAQNEIPGYVDHSIWVEKQLKIRKNNITLRADAINLSDKNYEIIRFFPMPGRNYRFSVSYKY